MKAVILSVGDEVLSGRVVNTNASFLAERLESIGVETIYTVVVGDNKETLVNELNRFNASDYELLITTGGLGPTHDDFTKEVIFESLDMKLELNLEAKETLDRYYKGDYAKCNIKQAYFPKESKIIPNLKGTACGAIVEKNNKIYTILVGPPFELKPMVNDTLIPYLKEKVNNDLLIKEYLVMGIGESQAEEILKPLINKYDIVNLAPYAKPYRIRYQITSHQNFKDEFNEVCRLFEEIMDEYIISSNNESIENLVVNELNRLGYHISTAESCTGGMISSTIVNVSGSSSVFNESIVTYSNEAKCKYLNVSPETINKYGVVSDQVIREMLIGLKDLTKSEVCIAVSGIAGPTGGTKEKPVGLVHYGILIEEKFYLFNNIFRGDREMVRTRTTNQCLYELFKILRKV